MPEKEEKQVDLQRTFNNAESRIERSLGVPAHAIKTQIERIAKELDSVGAVEHRKVFLNGEVTHARVITFGIVSQESGFFGLIQDGIIKFAPKKQIGEEIVLNLDESVEPHQIPGLPRGEDDRMIIGLETQAMTALRGVMENFLSKPSGLPINDDPDDGRAIRLEIGVQTEIEAGTQ